MNVIVKAPGEMARVVDFKGKYRGDVAQLIGEKVYSEYVQIINNEFCMVVDEDGHNKQLPHNFFMEMQSAFWPIQSICGTAVFCRYKWENPYEEELLDFELMDVLPSDMDMMNRIFDTRYQNELGVKAHGWR